MAVATILTPHTDEAGGIHIHHHDRDVVHAHPPSLAPPIGLLSQLVGEDTWIPEGRGGGGKGEMDGGGKWKRERKDKLVADKSIQQMVNTHAMTSKRRLENI